MPTKALLVNEAPTLDCMRVYVNIDMPNGYEHFTGKQRRKHLINLVRRAGYRVDLDQIQFRRIGKKSAAYVLALETLRGDKRPDLTLGQEDLLGEFRG